MSSNDAPLVDPNTDPYRYLGFEKCPDGSVMRLPILHPSASPSSDPEIPVFTKDIPINQDTNTWARVYMPNPNLESNPGPIKKLPLIVYYHGGGFVVGSASSQMFQKFLVDIIVDIQVVMVSVEYRLAPEHRLPAAYDDSMEALHCIKATNDEWLTKYADFSKCFLMGTSAGGNIAYQVGLRAIMCFDDLAPLKIRGLVLHQPFFGGVQRSLSEVRLMHDHVLPPVSADVAWELALPIGADRDHEYCNPITGITSEVLEKVKNNGVKLLVAGCDGDPLVDRQIELVKKFETNGVEVIGEFSDGGSHGCELFDESRAKIFNGVLKKFILLICNVPINCR